MKRRSQPKVKRSHSSYCRNNKKPHIYLFKNGDTALLIRTGTVKRGKFRGG